MSYEILRDTVRVELGCGSLSYNSEAKHKLRCAICVIQRAQNPRTVVHAGQPSGRLLMIAKMMNEERAETNSGLAVQDR